MKIVSRSNPDVSDELAQEYIDFIKQNKKSVKHYFCAFCMNKQISVSSGIKKLRSDAEIGLSDANSFVFDRVCMGCGGFCSEFYEVDLGPTRNFIEKGVVM